MGAAGNRVYTVLYDGTCRVCRRMVVTWKRWDPSGSLEILPYQAGEVSRRFHEITVGSLEESLQVIGVDGRVWNGPEAVARVLEVLPRRPMHARGVTARRLGGIAQLAYRLSARDHSRSGCSHHCQVDPRSRRSPPSAP